MAACQIRVRPQGRMSSPSTGDDSQPHEHENTSKQRGKVIARYLAGGAHLLWFANQYVLESACNRTNSVSLRKPQTEGLNDYSSNPNPEKHTGHLFIRSSHVDTPGPVPPHLTLISTSPTTPVADVHRICH
ncbi:hypothetical protein QR685DRAFT_449978 [Neurospora intermedia]|uniref:Questionable protein n=1 Tax=Neurospora intermedia TaxID=5142 RepID=A0ABR3D2H1_NEUIN